MNALRQNGTWELVKLPSDQSAVGCRWVYTVKVNPDGSVDRLKARLTAYSRTQGIFRSHLEQFEMGFSVHLGSKSNNFAELYAVFFGIQAALDAGFLLRSHPMSPASSRVVSDGQSLRGFYRPA